jgi:predicted transcriptional regulator
MNHVDITKSVKEQLAEHPERRGTRYPESLQKEVVVVAMQLREQGCSYSSINKELGMTGNTIHRWVQSHSSHRASFVPVRVTVPMGNTSALRVISPQGWVLEGLTWEQACSLMGKLL